MPVFTFTHLVENDPPVLPIFSLPAILVCMFGTAGSLLKDVRIVTRDMSLGRARSFGARLVDMVSSTGKD